MIFSRNSQLTNARQGHLRRLLFFALAFISSQMKLSATPPSQAPAYWPTQGWRSSPPEQQGIDSVKLAEALDYIRRHDINIHSLLIVRNGYVVLDAYFYPYDENDVHDLASVTKSVTSTLIGIAIDQGRIKSVGQHAPELFPQRNIANMDERKERITLESLLTMTSGLKCQFEENELTLRQMMGSNDWVQFMLDLPVINEPGSKFVYCSGGMHLLSGIISQTMGVSALDFARRELFQPLGVKDVVWPADPNGVTHGWGDLHLRPHDAAKIGYLWLNNGRWAERRIIPAEWMQDAIKVHSRAPWGGQYGYGIWVDPTRGLYEGNGRGGQRISVVPSKNLVVVFTGGGFEPGDIGKFILAALKSDQPLPENRAGALRLAEAIRTASKPPEPNSADPLPSIARTISGKTFLLEANPFGLAKLSLKFLSQPEALVQLTFADGHAESHSIGLDGVARRSAGGRFGLPVGLKGHWERGQTFVLDYDEIANINHYLLMLGFDGPRLTVQATEKTGQAEAKFNGKLAGN